MQGKKPTSIKYPSNTQLFGFVVVAIAEGVTGRIPARTHAQ
jgi:hypothetical protein